MTNFTGNPFVDAGIAMMENLPGTTLEKINKICEIYSRQSWQNHMRFIFPNSIVIGKDKVKREDNLKSFLKGLYDKKPNNKIMTCSACGQNEGSEFVRKSGLPLCGGSDNCFPGCSPGLRFCPQCVLSLWFMPLFVSYAAGKFILCHTPSEDVMQALAHLALDRLKVIGASDDIGMVSEGGRNNAIFGSMEQLAGLNPKKRDKSNITVYIFNNNNQGAELDIANVPDRLFRFICYMAKEKYREAWRTLVNSNYIVSKKKKSTERKNQYNRVYSALLDGKSILRLVPRQKEMIPLINIYCKEILGMQKEDLPFVKEIGAEIVKHIDNGGKKDFLRIDWAKSRHEFFCGVKKILKKSKIINNFSRFADFVYGGNYQELQHLLGIYVYIARFDLFQKSEKEEDEE